MWGGRRCMREDQGGGVGREEVHEGDQGGGA